MDNKETPISDSYQPAVTHQPPPPSYTPAQVAGQPHTQQTYIVQPAHTAVIINSTSTGTYIPVGKDPTRVRCPSCHSEVVTTVQTTATGRTHIWAAVLCLVGCWPCVCVPYCMDSCKASNHYCPVCNCYIGQFK